MKNKLNMIQNKNGQMKKLKYKQQIKLKWH